MNFYDNVAKDYNRNQEKLVFNYLDKLDSPNFFKEVKKVKNKKVLEIGSGTGRITGRIIKRNPSRIVCVDSSSKTRKILKKNFPDLDIKHSLSTISDKFDYVIFSHTLIHIKEKEKFFDKITKLLNPGGKIILSDLFQEKPVYSLDKNGKKVFQKIYPINLPKLKKTIQKKGLSLIKEEIIEVDKSRVPPFRKLEIGKKLTFFWILEKKRMIKHSR